MTRYLVGTYSVPAHARSAAFSLRGENLNRYRVGTYSVHGAFKAEAEIPINRDRVSRMKVSRYQVPAYRSTRSGTCSRRRRERARG
jgi:hypothetical protein